MHPDDEESLQSLKEAAARLRANRPPNPALERELEDFHVDPRQDPPAFSPKMEDKELQAMQTQVNRFQASGKTIVEADSDPPPTFAVDPKTGEVSRPRTKNSPAD
jgi:hypothetical protein